MATALGLVDTQICNELLFDLNPMSFVDIPQMQLTIGKGTPHSASRFFRMEILIDHPAVL